MTLMIIRDIRDILLFIELLKSRYPGSQVISSFEFMINILITFVDRLKIAPQTHFFKSARTMVFYEGWVTSYRNFQYGSRPT